MLVKTREIVDMATRLPLEERAFLIEKILESFNFVGFQEDDISDEKHWSIEAERRIEKYEKGETQGILAQEVFGRIRKLKKNFKFLSSFNYLF